MKNIGVIIVVMFCVFACKSPKAAMEELQSGKYNIVSIQGEKIDEKAQVDINFNTEMKRVSGSAGCNKFSSSYTLEKGKINLGLMVPNALETWFTNTTFVLSENNSAKASLSNSPSCVMGITFNMAPLFSHSICQGTILEWCSSADTRISSPSFNILENPLATKLIPWVAPEVKMISSLYLALKCTLIFSLAVS